MKLIHLIIASIFNIKIIKFFPHYNAIIVLYKIHKKKFSKYSFSSYGKYLLENESNGLSWYLNRNRELIFYNYKKYFFTNLLETEKINGLKFSYHNNIIKNKKYVIKVIKHYEKIWPKFKQTPAHGDLTFDNLIFKKNDIFIIDWENFKNKGEVWGFDLAYFLLSCLILPNLNKNEIHNNEVKEFKKIWKKIKKKIKSNSLKSNPLIFFEKKFKSDGHWKYVSKKNPKKFFTNKISRNIKQQLNKIF